MNVARNNNHNLVHESLCLDVSLAWELSYALFLDYLLVTDLSLVIICERSSSLIILPKKF
jgi:hypothetical protein